MLRWLTLFLACALPVMVAGQEVVCTPFDNNGDNIVGIGDLIDLLARFGDSDLDQDGVWDSADDCVGAYDTCGVCNGPGPQVLAIDTIIIVYDSIYVDAIDEWLTYELSRDTLLHLVCENPGCTDPIADNFDPYAEEGGQCFYADFCYTPTFYGYTYEVVQIGDQCWFAENLQTRFYTNGDEIPSGYTDDEWSDATDGAQSVFDSDSTNLITKGRLYNGYAARDLRGICPVGWHVPSDEEFMQLEIELGMSESVVSGYAWRGTDQGSQLKASPEDSTGWNGTNTSGFSAIQGGTRSEFGNYGADEYAYFWTPVSQSSGYSFMRRLHFSTQVFRNNANQRQGFSVRCLRDSE